MEINDPKKTIKLQNIESFQTDLNSSLLSNHSTSPVMTKQLKEILELGICSGLIGGINLPAIVGAITKDGGAIVFYAVYGALGGLGISGVIRGIITYQTADEESKKTQVITFVATVALSTIIGAVIGIPMKAINSFLIN